MTGLNGMASAVRSTGSMLSLIHIYMIGDLERATFSNIESQNISFAVHTIRPWLVRIEQAMDLSLIHI